MVALLFILCLNACEETKLSFLKLIKKRLFTLHVKPRTGKNVFHFDICTCTLNTKKTHEINLITDKCLISNKYTPVTLATPIKNEILK